MPDERLASISAPMLLLTGADSPAWMASAGHAVAKAVPHAVHRVLDGQNHNVSAQALAPELLEFFTS